jgi:hypothetical protein
VLLNLSGEWVVPLFRIREAVCPNLGQVNNDFVQELEKYLKLDHKHFPPHHHHPIVGQYKKKKKHGATDYINHIIQTPTERWRVSGKLGVNEVQIARLRNLNRLHSEELSMLNHCSKEIRTLYKTSCPC